MSKSLSVTLPLVLLAVGSAGWWHLHQQREMEAPDAAQSLRGAYVRPAIKRIFYGARLEPQQSVVLHGAGQSDQTSFAAYSTALSPSVPMLSMSYIDLHEDIPAYFARLKLELARYPNLIIPQIGLSLNGGNAGNHYEAAVASGGEDAHLVALCDGLRSLHRPVFLRIGYEFNGSWNGYVPIAYIAAYRHITEALRAQHLDDVATVWDWTVGAELDAEEGGASAAEAHARYMAFYPGDAWVDWWGFNVFNAAGLWSRATNTFLADADSHHKPVMIGESTPKGHSVSEGSRLIEAWYKPYFALIRSSPGIRAFSYIDWDWSIYPQWADWGDGRVEQNEEVLRFYRAELSNPLYANARPRGETLALLRAKAD